MQPQVLLQKATADFDHILQNRRFLHANPGTGFDIDRTLEYVQEQLVMLGFTPQRCGRAGLTATIGQGAPTFLLRADMDALPIAEESNLDFAAKNGLSHACGHDLHTAMLLEAAKLLKQYETCLHGTVKLMFQPAEEIFQGAQDMIDHGVLENVDAAMMLHVMAGLPLPTGTAIVSPPGVSAPAADYFEICVQGKGCHGSTPNAGVDSLTAAAHILLALQEIQSRELSVSEQAVLTIGTFHGGTAANAIADHAILGGTVRTFDEQVREKVKTRLCEIANAVATAFRASAQVTFGSGCPTLRNDAALCQCMEQSLRQLLGDPPPLPAMGQHAGGSEDFAYVSQKVPAVMVALAAGAPEKGYCYPQHHPQVRFDEAVLPIGSAIYAWAAISWLNAHGSDTPSADSSSTKIGKFSR